MIQTPFVLILQAVQGFLEPYEPSSSSNNQRSKAESTVSVSPPARKL